MTVALYLLAVLLALACLLLAILAIYALGKLSAADRATLDAKSEAASQRLSASVAANQRDSTRAQLAAANDALVRSQAETRAVEADCGKLRAALAAKETPAERSDRMGSQP